MNPFNPKGHGGTQDVRLALTPHMGLHFSTLWSTARAHLDRYTMFEAPYPPYDPTDRSGYESILSQYMHDVLLY